MTDWKISVGCAVAVGLWGAVVALLAAGTATGDVRLGVYGLACSAAAATASIRCYHVTTNRMLRDAFELGRESARVEDGSLRRVR